MPVFSELSPVIQAFLATSFTWFVTALGAGLVFFFRKINNKVLDLMLGFAAGVMIAASFWSLLVPAIEMSKSAGNIPWLAPAIGFLLGGGFLKLVDSVIPHVHIGGSIDQAEGIKTNWQRSILLVTAITIHNIPEGLAVGVAFGAAAVNLPSATLAGAVALAFGIALQNFPEGAAVSIPLRREGLSRARSFWYGQLSGMVEPVAGIVGALAVMAMTPLLPYALAFAAGTMIYVVVEEVIPEAQSSGNSDYATIGTMLGFVLMMILDVGLG